MSTAVFVRLLTPAETAKILRSTVATLATKRVRGGGPPFRVIGRRVFYEAQELDAWIASHPAHNSTSDSDEARHSAAGRRRNGNGATATL